ncbi:hypothetical protein IT571_02435 [Candidatus Sumerlaeota bacterium]|nr:hypothetical protein [Candidatus Sumerlaeota bacterium]
MSHSNRFSLISGLLVLVSSFACQAADPPSLPPTISVDDSVTSCASVREFVDTIRKNPDLSDGLDASGSRTRRLFVYEGFEQRFERKALPPATKIQGLDNTTNLGPHVKKKHDKRIRFDQKLPLNSTNLDNALSFAHVKGIVNPQNNWVTLIDAELENDKWPLNWNLGEDAAKPLTVEQVGKLLREKYKWDSGWIPDPNWHTLFVRDPSIQVWDGNIKGKKVRDLVYCILDESLKEQTENRKNLGGAFQILPVDVDASGIRAWNILYF